MDARELQGLMDRNSTQMRNLEQVIEGLRKSTDARYDDPGRIATLKAAIDSLHDLELDLNRELSRLNQKDKYYYAEDSEAPAGYKKLVEEYYKTLAKGNK